MNTSVVDVVEIGVGGMFAPDAVARRRPIAKQESAHEQEAHRRAGREQRSDERIRHALSNSTWNTPGDMSIFGRRLVTQAACLTMSDP